MDTSSHQDRLISYLFGPMQGGKTTKEKTVCQDNLK